MSARTAFTDELLGVLRTHGTLAAGRVLEAVPKQAEHDDLPCYAVEEESEAVETSSLKDLPTERSAFRRLSILIVALAESRADRDTLLDQAEKALAAASFADSADVEGAIELGSSGEGRRLVFFGGLRIRIGYETLAARPGEAT